MNKYPIWYDKDTMSEGILIVGVYFTTLKDNFQNDARRWFRNGLPNELEKRSEKISPKPKIEPLEYALTRYISPTKDERGRSKGGEYKYSIENATPMFYEVLFDILERKKESKKPEWFGDYYVLIARSVIKYG